MQPLTCALSILLCLAALGAKAEGSFSVDDEDFMSVRRQAPELWALLDGAFEIDRSGIASRIGSPVSPRLGGKRLGPYCLAAKRKDAPGGSLYRLCFNTEAVYTDASDKVVDSPAAAWSMREVFRSVEISLSK